MSCTACSRSIDYLDLRAKISLSGVISTIPRTKGSNLDVPMLQHTSCHNPSIHMSWPLNLLRRRLELCMDDESKHHMFNEFLGRFIVSGAPEELLSALRDAFKML